MCDTSDALHRRPLRSSAQQQQRLENINRTTEAELPSTHQKNVAVAAERTARNPETLTGKHAAQPRP
jgi:hypothetical protein